MLTAVAPDAAGNQATSGAVSISVSNDTTPPVISGVTASAITASAATIIWTPDEASDSQLDYGWNTPGSGDLIFGAAVATAGPIATISAGSGFTKRLTLNNDELVSEDKIQTTVGSTAATFTFSAASAAGMNNASSNTMAQAFASTTTPGDLVEGQGQATSAAVIVTVSNATAQVVLAWDPSLDGGGYKLYTGSGGNESGFSNEVSATMP
jgi:hypothetical protein